MGIPAIDAAMVTKSNLELLAAQGKRLVSRLPANFKLLDELKQAAWEAGNWTSIADFVAPVPCPKRS